MAMDFWDKEFEDVEISLLMPYTLSKICPFEQARYYMFFKDNMYQQPPEFVWRFSGTDTEVYTKLDE
jgi:hypothetical protein